MHFFHTVSLLILPILLLSACEQNGGAMPIDAQKLLSSFDGPKISPMYDTQLAAAKSAEDKDNFKEAVQIYQQILEKEPDNIDIVLLLADSLRRGGEYGKAVSAYDTVLVKDAVNITAKEGKGLALLANGDFETPTSLFDDVLKVDIKRWKSLNGMGILFVTRKLYPEATQYFEEALKQSPANASVMNNLGLSQALNKQYDKAIEYISRASAQSPVSSSQRKRIDLNLALVYASAGKLEEARKVAEIYLSGAALSNNLGLYAHLAKNDELAKSYLNMALTESKTYYGKAWENLEGINGKDDNKNDMKNITDDTSKAQKESQKKEPKKESKKDKSSNKKQESKVSIKQEPIAEKSEVKPVVIIDEVKEDENKSPAPAPTAPMKSLENSLGKIRIPAN